jgi:hypothetical protein
MQTIEDIGLTGKYWIAKDLLLGLMRGEDFSP